MPNPNHDPKNGQFTSGGNGGGGGAEHRPISHFGSFEDDDYGPMPTTRYSGIDKPNPTLDEVLPADAKRRLQDAFGDLRFPSSSGPPQHHGARPPGKR